MVTVIVFPYVSFTVGTRTVTGRGRGCHSDCTYTGVSGYQSGGRVRYDTGGCDVCTCTSDRVDTVGLGVESVAHTWGDTTTRTTVYTCSYLG